MSKADKSTVRELTFDFTKYEEDQQINRALFTFLRKIRRNLSELVICGFNGNVPARTEGSTFGIRVDKLPETQLTGSQEHPFTYAYSFKKPALAVYDIKHLEYTDLFFGIHNILRPEALLAIIKLIDKKAGD